MVSWVVALEWSFPAKRHGALSWGRARAACLALTVCLAVDRRVGRKSPKKTEWGENMQEGNRQEMGLKLGQEEFKLSNDDVAIG